MAAEIKGCVEGAIGRLQSPTNFFCCPSDQKIRSRKAFCCALPMARNQVSIKWRNGRSHMAHYGNLGCTCKLLSHYVVLRLSVANGNVGTTDGAFWADRSQGNAMDGQSSVASAVRVLWGSPLGGDAGMCHVLEGPCLY